MKTGFVHSKIKICVSHPTGNANVRNVLKALADAGLLASFQTTFASFPSGFWQAISCIPGFGEIRRRSYEEGLRAMVRSAPIREIGRLAALRLGLAPLVRKEKGMLSIEKVYEHMDRKASVRVSGPDIGSCYCYEDGALHTFRAAKAAGKKCFYDLPIGYWRSAHEILTEEAGRRPQWRATMDGLSDSAAKLERKDQELRLADQILVASTFTKQTLEKCPFPLSPIAVTLYGADDVVRGGRPHPRGHSGKLRVLFVGSLSQRKGIADLFEAASMVGPAIELTLIGRKAGVHCPALDRELSRHRWIPSLPREKILAEMRGHDVLVFPSLFEGFGLVVTEALSQGLPVITTTHTCGPDVLTDGEDGFIVPIRDPQAIAGKLELLHRDRERLAGMSEAARKKSEMLKWADYRRRIVEVVTSTSM